MTRYLLILAGLNCRRFSCAHIRVYNCSHRLRSNIRQYVAMGNVPSLVPLLDEFRPILGTPSIPKQIGRQIIAIDLASPFCGLTQVAWRGETDQLTPDVLIWFSEGRRLSKSDKQQLLRKYAPVLLESTTACI